MTRLRRDPIMLGAMAWLAVVVVVAVGASWLAPSDPNDQDLARAFAGFGPDHLLGADHLGRDVLSRLMHGARIAGIAVLITTVVALAIGVTGGLVLGYRGGRIDRYSMRFVEVVMSVPPLVTALVVITLLGAGLTTAMFAVGLTSGFGAIRLVRGVTLEVREELFVEASRAIGTPHRQILVGHVIPNIAGPLAVEATHIAAVALLAEAALSFIGLGVQPPDPSWGVMLADSGPYLYRAARLSVLPGIAIALTVLAINLVGDHLSDRLAGHHDRSHLLDRRLDRTAPQPVAVERDGTDELVVRGLTVATGPTTGSRTELVSDVSFTVRRGEVLALVGESGCGKSMTASALLGLLPPGVELVAGTVLLGDVDLTSASPARMAELRRTEIGVVFQDPMTSLNPSHDLRRQLTEVLRLEGSSRADAEARAVEALTLVGIPDPVARLDAYPHELSGGMAQRAAIAAALVHRPSVLVLDEPTTALDVTIQGEVLDVLHDLRRELGLTMLFITHDFGVVADIADRALVMYAGQAVEEGDLEQIFGHAEHPYTRALLRSLPEHAEKGVPLPVIDGRVPPASDWAVGCRFRPRCPVALDDCVAPVELVVLGERRACRCVHALRAERTGLAETSR